MFKMEVRCEFCLKELTSSTLLKHISHEKACESHYCQERLNEMKKEKEKLRKRQYRKNISIEQKKTRLKDFSPIRGKRL